MRGTAIGVLIAAAVWCPAWADTPKPAEKQTTIAFLHSLQRANGGFAADNRAETPPTLPATSSAMRALKYFGGQVKNKEGCKKFVRSCYDASSGGFAPTPGGQPDVRTTVVGTMAVIELGMLSENDRYVPLYVEYQRRNVKTFEDIRIAAAGLEALGVRPPLSPPSEGGDRGGWLQEIRKLRNADGTYGKGAGVARDTGSAVAAILRLGGKVEDKMTVLKAIRNGQLPDGGFGKDGQKGSDLESTYRVMRALAMMKEKPNIEGCGAFIARCRNSDGSYSVQPGQPGNVSATYFAGIILHWLDEMQ